jgi:predicted dienelactone hydrolase
MPIPFRRFRLSLRAPWRQFVAPPSCRNEARPKLVSAAIDPSAAGDSYMQRFLSSIATGVLAALLFAAMPAPAAQAGWRQIKVPGVPGAQEPIAVNLYYPTAAFEIPVALGPFSAHVAPQATPEASFKGLIVISHGLGGSELVHESLAEALARSGYLVAALRHPGDNWQDHSLIERGPVAYLEERPRQVSRVLDALLADPQWSARVARDAGGPRIGALGHSAGGYTVLALVGGRFDVARFREHCAAHRDDDPIFCRRAGSNAVPVAAGTSRDASPLADPRVRAVVALVPVGAVFDAASLEGISIPVLIYSAEKDRFLVPRFHALYVASHMPAAALHVVPNAWHFAFADPPGMAIPSDDGDLRDDPPGFDRPAFLRQLQGDLPAFFDTAFKASAAMP